MKIFGVSRAAASCAGVALFAWAQAAGFCQNFGTRPQMVVAKTDAYLIGSTQMLVSAHADFLPHPQGRYALVMQHGAAAMPAPLLGKAETGAASLFLYDSHLNQTRLIFQCRADTAKHRIEMAWWLPQSDCALVIVRDGKPAPAGNTLSGDSDNNIGDESADDAPPVEKKSDQTDTYTDTLLFFDFEKNTPPRVLATKNDGGNINVLVSPTKPVFIIINGNVARMGSAPRGTLGPARQLPSNTDLLWYSASGTSTYEVQSVAEKAASGEEARVEVKWYEWDGIAPSATPIKSRPTDAMIAQKPKMPPLPLMLRSGALPVPATIKRSTLFSMSDAVDTLFGDEEEKSQSPVTASQTQAPPPNNPPPAKKRGLNDRQTILHPLYLEAVDASATPDAANQSALIAPDAPDAVLLPDQSAVLYQSGGAVYVVPLVHLNGAAYGRLQKTLAQQKAQTIGKAILMYTQDYDDVFPLQNNFVEIVNPYVKDDALFQTFTYTNPNVPLGSVKFPATTIMGYVTAPGGRAIVYVDGHVQWKTQ